MPSRPVIALILLFWLGAIAWYVSREVAPGWGLDDVPPYHIDLTDEVGASTITWEVMIDDKLVGRGLTRVKRRDPGLYEFRAEFRFQHVAIAPEVELTKWIN